MSELSKIIQRCNPDFDTARAISWQVEGPVEESWRGWMKELFEPLLLPHLLRVLEASARQSAREIIAAGRGVEPEYETLAATAQYRCRASAASAKHAARRTTDGQAAGSYSDRRRLWAFRDFVWGQMRGVLHSDSVRDSRLPCPGVVRGYVRREQPS